jgi:hypothetical protein
LDSQVDKKIPQRKRSQILFSSACFSVIFKGEMVILYIHFLSKYLIILLPEVKNFFSFLFLQLSVPSTYFLPRKKKEKEKKCQTGISYIKSNFNKIISFLLNFNEQFHENPIPFLTFFS